MSPSYSDPLEDSFDLMVEHFWWFTIFLAGWTIYHKVVNWLLPQKKPIYYATFLSLTHAVLATSTAIYLFVTSQHQNSTIMYPHLMSMAYFTQDLSACWRDPVFLGHHICSLIMIGATRYLQSHEYNYWSNILLMFAECTAILQNHFFLQKTAYGEDRKVEFNRKYLWEFKLFARSFKTCRLVILPVLLVLFLYRIEESFYFWIVAVNSTAVIAGSIYWVNGQNKMLKRMQKKDS